MIKSYFKYFIFILTNFILIAFTSNLWAGVYWPACTATGSKEIPERVKHIDCEQREISKSIVAQSEIVPTVLYHFGEIKAMNENVKARTIPEEAWNKFIMGGGGRYRLGSLRRGLYGTATLEINSFSNSSYSQLIEIHLKPECIKAEKVVSLSHLNSDPKFVKWFQTAQGLPFSSFSKMESVCFPEGAGAGIDLSTGVHWNADPTLCTGVIDKFLKEAGIKAIQDDLVSKSFYVRDRSCIQTILGTPEELLQIFADKSYLWMNSCDDEDPLNNYQAKKLFRIVKEALLRTNTEIPHSTYTQLVENINMLHVIGSGKDPRKLWTATIQAHERCYKNKKLDEFVSTVTSDWEHPFFDPNLLCKDEVDSKTIATPMAADDTKSNSK